MIQPYYEEPGITIYNADCRDVLPQLEKVDLVLTDPPYGVNFQYLSHDDSPIGYSDFIMPIFKRVMELAKTVMLTPGMRNLWLYPPADWVLCWAKPGSTRRSYLGGFNEWEPVLVYGKPRIYNDFKYLPDCANHSSDSGDHPCPKPLALYLWLIGQTAAHTVLDPFMGSGTTLVAAKQLGRKAIGIEIEKKYCDIAIKRLAQGVLFGVEQGA